MARRRGGPVAVCPVLEHADSHVVSHGRRQTKSGARRVFKCQPPVGDHHFFTVIETVDVPLPVWSPPPTCPQHAAGHVVRDGKYASTTAKPRQRYRCYPDPADRDTFHRFTPPLPRDHVHVGHEQCAACEELRGTHRGDATISRHQSWSTRLVAESLRDLARGETYARTSMRAWERTNRTRTRKGAVAPPSTEGRRAWHTAADWVEVYSPVLYDVTDARLRHEAAGWVERRARHSTDQTTSPTPITVVIDDQPVFAKAVSESGRRGGRPDWFVLTLAEVRWMPSPRGLDRDLKLRLVRALPTNDQLAWKLVFDELGYTPDFVISDGDDSQAKAVEKMFGTATMLIPSMFHVRNNVELALLESSGTYTKASRTASAELHPEFGGHLALLGRRQLTTMTATVWSDWWDQLEKLLAGRGAPQEPVRRRRDRYEQAVATVLPAIAAHPQLPLSTGGLEVAMRRRIEPLLDGRAHTFANLERTNRLFDLVVCDEHGLFNELADVIALLRADGSDHGGWSTPLRQVTDPQPSGAGRWAGRYSSLRDPLLLRDIARSRGLG